MYSDAQTVRYVTSLLPVMRFFLNFVYVKLLLAWYPIRHDRPREGGRRRLQSVIPRRESTHGKQVVLKLYHPSHKQNRWRVLDL